MTERPLPLLDKTEAAKYLNISVRTLERLMKIRELSPIYITRRPRFTYDDLDALAERNRAGGRHDA